MEDKLRRDIDRKKDHIELAIASATQATTRDERFYYEPVLSSHPADNRSAKTTFIGAEYGAPMWVSSMTGGTAMAKIINKNLALACKEFELGMGLGSCRKLLDSDEYLEDFQVRKYIGDRPLYANLGIAQIIDLIKTNTLDKVTALLDKLEATGLIIHINPTQEWLQPEGDRYSSMTPIQAIQTVISHIDTSIIVKEVGQGMGPKSLKELMELPIDAIEFGAYGGTNFAKLENLRDPRTDELDPICFVGHDAGDMVEYIHYILANNADSVKCQSFIVSGGIRDYLDGYYYTQLLQAKSIYGQAAGFLKHAQSDYSDLAYHVERQIRGYAYAQNFLKVRS